VLPHHTRHGARLAGHFVPPSARVTHLRRHSSLRSSTPTVHRLAISQPFDVISQPFQPSSCWDCIRRKMCRHLGGVIFQRTRQRWTSVQGGRASYQSAFHLKATSEPFTKPDVPVVSCCHEGSVGAAQAAPGATKVPWRDPTRSRQFWTAVDPGASRLASFRQGPRRGP
jgi:hypothetical protein